MGQAPWSQGKVVAASRELPECVKARYRRLPDESLIGDDCDPPRALVTESAKSDRRGEVPAG